MSALKRKRGGKGPGGKAKKVKLVENGNKPQTTEMEQNKEITVPAPVSMGKWRNKERVLVFSSRGINFRTRHLMQDLRTMMPHTKADTKMDRKDKLFVINEVCEIKNCNKCLFFEFTSNPLRQTHTSILFLSPDMASCPLTWLPQFDTEPHYALLKELFIQTFSTPQYHPRSQPFVDHVFTVWNIIYSLIISNSIIEEDASMVEIGPRFVLNLIKIFQGSFGGPTLFENPHFESPNTHRRVIRMATASRLKEKQMVKELQKLKRTENKEAVTRDVTDDVFATPAEERPVHIELEAPAAKVVKKNKHKAFKRQRKQKR
uniref:Ribosome biogenesis protein BRX1 homolog n=1 Tax=Oncorhynchus kisutch TaxID=8019 RepID=A0A8C7MS82_ONCKI